MQENILYSPAGFLILGQTKFIHRIKDDKPDLSSAPYISNGRDRMDNHPLMIMAQQKRKVS